MKLLQRYLEMAQKARKMTTFQSFFLEKKLQLQTELLDKYRVYYCIENYSFFPTDPTKYIVIIAITWWCIYSAHAFHLH